MRTAPRSRVFLRLIAGEIFVQRQDLGRGLRQPRLPFRRGQHERNPHILEIKLGESRRVSWIEGNVGAARFQDGKKGEQGLGERKAKTPTGVPAGPPSL